MAYEVQRVCHDDAVEGRKVESSCKIGNLIGDTGRGKARAYLSFLPIEGLTVFIHRVNLSLWAEQVGKGEGEGSTS